MAPVPRWRLPLLRRAIRGGGVIAYPTEGVWGLGCDPANPFAVQRILKLKNRAWQQGLILIASELEYFAPYLENLPPDIVPNLLDWPEATTYLVPDNGLAPEWILGEHDTLALRLTKHPVAAALSSLIAGPLVSTSANPAGSPAALSALEVRRYFGDQVDLIVPGALGSSKGPSEIKHLLSGQVMRPAEEAEALEAAF
ncbi:MAG: L-threonylcarbamoyladenylate synthase [Pseudomonadales bacterium]